VKSWIAERRAQTERWSREDSDAGRSALPSADR